MCVRINKTLVSLCSLTFIYMPTFRLLDRLLLGSGKAKNIESANISNENNKVNSTQQITTSYTVLIQDQWGIV